MDEGIRIQGMYSCIPYTMSFCSLTREGCVSGYNLFSPARCCSPQPSRRGPLPRTAPGSAHEHRSCERAEAQTLAHIVLTVKYTHPSERASEQGGGPPCVGGWVRFLIDMHIYKKARALPGRRSRRYSGTLPGAATLTGAVGSCAMRQPATGGLFAAAEGWAL